MEINPEAMLTKEEIREIEINPEIVRLGLVDAEKRMVDMLDNKSQLDNRCLLLFAGYITMSFAIYGLAASLGSHHPLFIPLIISGTAYYVGIIFLVMALKTTWYGTLGRTPDTWLQKGTIDGDNRASAYIQAYCLHDYYRKLIVSVESNGKKSSLLNFAVLLGAASPALFAITFLVIYCVSPSH